MLTQPTRTPETGQRSGTPDGDRLNTRALLAALEIWLLALLAPLMGAQAARAWIASILPNAPQAEIPSDFSEEEIRLLIPFLFLIGPGPNRGMASHARMAPIPHQESARAPPDARAPSSPSLPKSAPRADDDSCPKRKKGFFFF